MVCRDTKLKVNGRQMALFTDVKKKHINYMSSMLWKLTGDMTTYQMAMEHALFEMWENVEKLSGVQQRAALYQIMLAANRQAWRRRKISCPADLSSHRAHISRVFDARIRLAGRIQWALSRLTLRHAIPVVMRYLERQDDQAIAAVLGCDTGEVGERVSHGIAMLKDKIRRLSPPAPDCPGESRHHIAYLNILAG